MAIGIDDIYDDDGAINEPDGQQSEGQDDGYQQEEDDNFMLDFLHSKGIEDPEKIKFEDDNGEIIERSWDDLTREEQINILNTPLETTTPQQVVNTPDNSLTDEEIMFINQLRYNGMTPTQFVNQFQVPETEPQYRVDELSDDELYILDLESRVGELSDEDASVALATAKQNEDFYKKQVDGIRKEYKEREDFKTQQEQAEIEQQQQEAYNAYQENVVNAIDSFNSIGNLDLNFEDSDKEELAEFMLSQDQSGNNYLYRALQEPENLVKAAWFILNGEDAFNSISDYFTNQIKLVSESQYKKGFEEGRNNTQPSRPTLVFGNNSGKTSIKDLDDLDFE